MAKLVDAEQAARILGITVDEVNNLRERRELYAKRDGSDWKFGEDEIQRYARERAEEQEDTISDQDSGDLSDVPPEIGDDLDSILLSEVELGKSPDSTTSTIIGKGKSPESSDIKLAGSKSDPNNEDDLALEGGSDVELKLDPASASGLKLVPGGSGIGEDLDLNLDLTDDSPATSDDLGDLGLADSGIGMKEDSGLGLGLSDSSPSLADSNVNISEEGSGLGLGLADSSPSLADSSPSLASDSSVSVGDENKGGASGLMGGSTLDLASSDEEMVVGGSDSDITAGGGDSGIGVATPSDIGMSLEGPEMGGSGTDMLELGDEDVMPRRREIEEDDAPAELHADDEFLLTPAKEGAGEESDSGSQVIALDTAEDDEFAVAGLGKRTSAVLEEEAAPASAVTVGPSASSSAVGAPAAPDIKFSMGNIVVLAVCVMFLMVGGMMTYDLVRNMWSWDSPYVVNSSIMDSLAKWF